MIKSTGSYKSTSKLGVFTTKKGKSITLDVERAIGEFLVDKGLATSDNYCDYTINTETGSQTFSISYNYQTGGLEITIGDVTQTVFISLIDTRILTAGDLTINGVTYTSGTNLHSILQQIITWIGTLGGLTENGISGDGQIGSPIKLGGVLTEDTTIDGDRTYYLNFQDLTRFSVNTDGDLNTAISSLLVSGLQSQPSHLQHTDKFNPTRTAQIDLDFNDQYGLKFTDNNGSVGWLVYPGSGVESDILAVTRNQRDGTASIGQILTLIGPNGEVEFSSISGGGYTVIQEDGVSLTQRSALNFVGESFTVSDVGGVTQVDASPILEELSQIVSPQDGDILVYNSGWTRATPIKDVQVVSSGDVLTLPSIPTVGCIVDVYLNGVLKEEGVDYTISSDVITFSYDFQSNDKVTTKYY